ncbi:hypothetical protein DMH04_17755 [Kibdelosporangium aridum]|uniref:Transmembrane protein n=1 Tax=Kibdelosporangium aridum TaxID=2030 RepID=A0A428ZB00_KIBAR|nr:hypothetical protein [Kibdelosporangium aridum]RSM85148.1 hypothetical protein DMH04_17755 [Kibdelosporangium aridum]
MWTYRIAMLLRRFSFGRNPLRRRSDRIESSVLTGMVALLIAVVPIAIQLNEDSYQSGLRAAEHRTTTLVQTTAILQEDAPPLDGPAVRGPVQKPKVRAVWTAADGTAREGLLEVRSGTPAGMRIPVWTDRFGALTSAPMTPLDVRSHAVVAAAALVSAWVLVLMIVFYVVRKVLDHYRLRAWEDEWGQVEPKWRRPTRW